MTENERIAIASRSTPPRPTAGGPAARAPGPRFALSGRAAALGKVFVTTVGLFVFSLGMVLNVRSNAGLSPWQALHVGLTLHTPLSLGQASQLVGGVMVGVSWLFGVRPGVATVMNAVLVGWFMDGLIASGLIRSMETGLGGYVMLGASLVLSGLGIAGYIKGGLGAGPRDSFMLALMRLFGRGPAVVRVGIELGAALGGFVLGAPLGAGTLLFAVGLGPSVGYWFRLLRVRPPTRDATTRSARAPIDAVGSEVGGSGEHRQGAPPTTT